MKTQKQFNSFCTFVLILIAFTLIPCCKEKTRRNYEPTLESLESHPAPKWFSDAKFGIFIHWGVYAVPAFNEWYIEYMSPRSTWGKSPLGQPYTAARGDLPDSIFASETQGIRGEANRYHRDNYGVDFEYDEFIPMFKAENFDPGSWADLFKQSGAKYVVLTAKHGDEFALWPTRHT